jgi:hypothetical protein
MDLLNIKILDIMGDKDYLISEFPRGQSLESLFNIYFENPEKYRTLKKSSTKKHKWIHDHIVLMDEMFDMFNSKRFYGPFSELMAYSRLLDDVKKQSSKLKKPHKMLSLDNPLLVELNVMNIGYELSKFPAGYNLKYGNSFKFDNKFVEQVRHDKSSTTPYSVVHDIAKANSVVGKRIY